VKFGLFYELQLPKPVDADWWPEDAERRVVMDAIEQIEFADKLGFDYVFEVEHHFLEEYSHSAAPEVVLAAASQRTKNIRLGHGIIQMPWRQNHPARVAERVATLDIVSGGRVEFGTGEGATDIELGGFGTPRVDKKSMWEEATRECLRMMSTTPYPGFQGRYLDMPARNVIPKPIQKPHPPVWVAASRKATVQVAGRLGIASLGLGFESAGELGLRVADYWDLVRDECMPIGAAINPAVTTVANLMCCKTEEESLAKGLPGAGFFAHSIGRVAAGFRPGEEHFNREFHALRDRPQSPAAEPEDETTRTLIRAAQRGGFMGTPDFIRESVREYEAAHLDALIFIVQCGDRRHEDIMASLELFAKEVMPEFKERHHLQQAWRAQQLERVDLLVNSSI